MSAKSATSRVASDAPWARAVAAITASAVAMDRPNGSRRLSSWAYQWAASLLNGQIRPENTSAVKAFQLCCRFCLRRPSGSRASGHNLELYVNPDLNSNSPTAKALKAHQINGDYLGKVLIHWNTSIVRGKNGIIIFENGILVSKFFQKPKLFYF